MPFHFVIVPQPDSGVAEQELNAFLRSHRVLSIDRQWVQKGEVCYWSFCIDYLESAGTGVSNRAEQRVESPRQRVDYREVLSPDDFKVYARLRDLRKQIAQSDAVPLYTIFTNEQMARFVQQRASSRADLEKIAGVGYAVPRKC